MKLTLFQKTIILLTGFSQLTLAQETGPLEIGTTVGIDFGISDGTSASFFWNDITTTASGTFPAGTIIDTSGTTINNLGFSWSAATIDSNAPDIIAGTPAFPNTALDDAMLTRSSFTNGDGDTSDGTFTLTFTGLDDSLYYDITLGQSNSSTNGNTDTAWTIGSITLDASPVENGASAYVTFNSVESSGGQITITSTPIDGGLDISAISALQLTATDVPPPGPAPLPAPPALTDTMALRFSPTVLQGSATSQHLNEVTIGGTWTTNLSGLSSFEDLNRGFAFVTEGANSQGDFVEVTLDTPIDFSANDIAINFQMLGTQIVATGDHETSVIGYDGTTEIFRLRYISDTVRAQNTITATTADGDEAMGFTPLRGLPPTVIPSGFQDFRIILSNGHITFSGSSLDIQDGPALNGTQTLTSLRWENSGSTTASQGFWLDDLIIRDGLPSPPRPATDRPNIIFMLVDDSGYSDVSVHYLDDNIIAGTPQAFTTNIDRLARNGSWFTHFHAAANICTPARAALLTGAYPQRAGLPYGINENRQAHWFLGLNPEEITIAEQLRKKSYRNLMIGKWHLGSEDLFSYYNQGFDSYYGVPSNFGHNDEFLDETEIVFNNAPQARLSSFYNHRATEYIRENRNQPFFLYYSHQYPHTPFTEGNAFDGATGNGTRADVIKELDWSMGQLVAELEANGILENTIIIYSADNGAVPGVSNVANLPLRGSKFNTFEGGHRLPFIFYWKDQIQNPGKRDERVVAMDLFPTLSEIVNIPLPNDRVYDGISLTPLFTGGTLSREDQEPFYYYNNQNLQAVRRGDWKLHVPRTAAARPFWDNQGASTVYRLYNLANDLDESNNVAAANPEIVAELTALADAIVLKLGDYMEPGSEQRATGSLFPEVPILQNQSDWDQLSLEERGRGATQFNATNLNLGSTITGAQVIPGGWQYLEASSATNGTEIPLTAGTAVGTEGNLGYSGTGSASILGAGAPFVINSANTGNNAIQGQDLLITPDDTGNNFVIIRYTVSAGDIQLGREVASISGSFRDLVGGTSDNSVSAQIYHNNSVIFSALGSGGRLTQANGTFAITNLRVKEGDSISFVVGSNEDASGDEVALNAAINFEVGEVVPEDLDLRFPSDTNFAEQQFINLLFTGTPGLSYTLEQSSDLGQEDPWVTTNEYPFLPTATRLIPVETNGEKMFWRMRVSE